jgi:hypothetical protein
MGWAVAPPTAFDIKRPFDLVATTTNKNLETLRWALTPS